MIIFDASNRDQCEVNRLKTSTPLQALVMMNDPTVLEASRVFAEKMTTKGEAPGQAITVAFKNIICRTPDKKELDILNTYYKNQLALFNNKKDLAQKTVSVGEYPYSYSLSNLVQTAALMRVINIIYNMEEAIVRG